jgi:hypothetical protein
LDRQALLTPEGFAARLAVDCGAFGYTKKDQKKAQKAFANLPDE